MTNNVTPTYNLKAVVRETGLKPDTLRAWERRYGVPDPERTEGGHRLYSQHDINTLKWLLARQDEGMSISRAVNLLQNLKDEGRDPLQVFPLNLADTPPRYTPVEMGDSVVELRHAWVEACLEFDERRAEMVLNQAFSYFSPETVCMELIQKALVEIGTGWYEGSISVQQEHFTSSLANRRLSSLLAATPAPTRSGRIIVGCSPGDTHTFGPMLVTLLLRRRGWDVVYLGADVPVNRLHATIEHTRPDLVVFSAQVLDSAASLLDLAQQLYDKNVPLAYGGYIFGEVPDLRNRIPGHFLGSEMNEIPQIIENLVANPEPIITIEAVSEDYRKAWAYFRERAGMIEAQMWKKHSRMNAGLNELGGVDHYLTRNILSALKLGDMNYIDSNMHWVEGMLANYNIPAQALHMFLTDYHQAAVQYLDEPAGKLVVTWLKQVVDNYKEAAGS